MRFPSHLKTLKLSFPIFIESSNDYFNFHESLQHLSTGSLYFSDLNYKENFKLPASLSSFTCTLKTLDHLPHLNYSLKSLNIDIQKSYDRDFLSLDLDEEILSNLEDIKISNQNISINRIKVNVNIKFNSSLKKLTLINIYPIQFCNGLFTSLIDLTLTNNALLSKPVFPIGLISLFQYLCIMI